MVDQGARERDTLALAARELNRLALAEARQLHDLEHLVDAETPIAPGHALHAQPVGDVLAHGHVREERVVLEDGVDVPRVRRQAGDVAPRKLDPPLVGALEACDQAERRRLAGAGGAKQCEELAGGDLEVDAVDGDHVAVRLADADEPNVWHVHAGTGLGRSVFLNSHYSARLSARPAPRHKRDACSG